MVADLLGPMDGVLHDDDVLAEDESYAEYLQSLLDRPFSELNAEELTTVTAIHAVGGREELREMLGVIQALSDKVARMESDFAQTVTSTLKTHGAETREDLVHFIDRLLNRSAGSLTMHVPPTDTLNIDRRVQAEDIVKKLNGFFEKRGWRMRARVKFDSDADDFANILNAVFRK